MQLTVNANHIILKRETTPSYILATDNIRPTITTKGNDYAKATETQVHAGLDYNWSLPYAVDAKD